MIAGDQLPTIPLVEVVGNAGIDAPLQNGPTVAKLGRTELITVIVPVAFTEPQLPKT